jgi:hypothetical protein
MLLLPCVVDVMPKELNMVYSDVLKSWKLFAEAINNIGGESFFSALPKAEL